MSGTSENNGGKTDSNAQINPVDESGDASLEGDDPIFANMNDPQRRLEQQQTRLRYQQALDEAQKAKDDDLDDITGQLISNETIFEKTMLMPREGALDAKVVNTLASKGEAAAKSLDTNLLMFSPKEYAVRMRNFMSPTEGSPLDWGKFGKQASIFFDRAPAFNFMYGSFMTEEQEKKAKAPTKRNSASLQVNEAQRQAPEKVDNMGRNDQEATTEEVERVLNYLRRLCNMEKGPICFFEFAVNPDSFMETVMNIFHISFLIKDGYANVFLDDDGLLAIEDVPPKGNLRQISAEPEKHQVILSMNKAEWREIVKEYGIEKPAIPPAGQK